MDKPKISAYCESGCLYETVHKEDFVEEQNNNEVKSFNGEIVSIGGGEYGFEIQLNTLVSDDLAKKCFIEIYGASEFAKNYLKTNLLRVTITAGAMYMIFSKPTSSSVVIPLYLKITKYNSTSTYYIHS